MKDNETTNEQDAATFLKATKMADHIRGDRLTAGEDMRNAALLQLLEHVDIEVVRAILFLINSIVSRTETGKRYFDRIKGIPYSEEKSNKLAAVFDVIIQAVEGEEAVNEDSSAAPEAETAEELAAKAQAEMEKRSKLIDSIESILTGGGEGDYTAACSKLLTTAGKKRLHVYRTRLDSMRPLVLERLEKELKNLDLSDAFSDEEAPPLTEKPLDIKARSTELWDEMKAANVPDDRIRDLVGQYRAAADDTSRLEVEQSIHKLIMAPIWLREDTIENIKKFLDDSTRMSMLMSGLHPDARKAVASFELAMAEGDWVAVDEISTGTLEWVLRGIRNAQDNISKQLPTGKSSRGRLNRKAIKSARDKEIRRGMQSPKGQKSAPGHK